MAKAKVSDGPDWFWDVIDKAKQDPDRLRDLLKEMNRGKLIRFHRTYERLADELRTERFSSHADPELSEDGIWELANWVVAQGSEYYRKVIEDPKKIPSKKDDVGFMSEVVLEYKRRYGGDLPPNTSQD